MLSNLPAIAHKMCVRTRGLNVSLLSFKLASYLLFHSFSSLPRSFILKLPVSEKLISDEISVTGLKPTGCVYVSLISRNRLQSLQLLGSSWMCCLHVCLDHSTLSQVEAALGGLGPWGSTCQPGDALTGLHVLRRAWLGHKAASELGWQADNRAVQNNTVLIQLLFQ